VFIMEKQRGVKGKDKKIPQKRGKNQREAGDEAERGHKHTIGRGDLALRQSKGLTVRTIMGPASGDPHLADPDAA
jgi:hypothetical protein